MNLMNIKLSTILAAVAFFSFAPFAAAQQELVAGRDFVAVEPIQPTDNPAKIEVTEFFSYACSHCNALNPLISEWAEKLPADVEFKRVPVGFNPFYKLMAKFYYTLEAIGELKRLDAAVFAAIHDKGLRLVDEKSLTEWVVLQGVDAKKFSDAFNSFSVSSKATRGDQLAAGAKIKGVPAIFVDGRYLVAGGSGSYADLLVLTDRVIAKRRGERNKK